jgi:hypothetical protein
MRAFIPNLACNHSALSIESPGLPEPSEARSPANGLPSFPFTGPSEQTDPVDETGDGRQAQAALQEGSSVGFPEERLLLPFYLFGLTLWILSAQTMRVSWLAVAVVGVLSSEPRLRFTARILERLASSRSRQASPFLLSSPMEPPFKVHHRRSIVSMR